MSPLPKKCCRLCGDTNIEDIIDLGKVPSIHILKKDKGTVPTFPIHLFICGNCGLVQMPLVEVARDVYEDSQHYMTSHQGHSYIRDLIDSLSTFRFPEKGLEIGCNDGSFLSALASHGFGPLVGIEPNAHAAKIASGRGLNIEQCYFDGDAVRKLIEKYGKFDFVVARHVLEHVDQIGPFLEGVHQVLNENGVFLLELPFVEPGFKANAVNVLWEEHINYFFEPVIADMLRNFGFRTEFRRQYTGGALVVATFSVRTSRPAVPTWSSASSISTLLEGYANHIDAYREQLSKTLGKAAQLDCLKVIYGAGFRTATTINTMGIANTIDAVIDDRPELHGYLMPGTCVRINTLDELEACGRPILLMLGVGAEHERMILKKVRQRCSSTVIPLSLVYPGSLIKHCIDAEKSLAALGAIQNEG